jgi:hypothetical protein
LKFLKNKIEKHNQMPKVKAKPSNPPLQQEERIDLLERRIDKELGEIKELLQGMMYSRMAIKESSEESEDIEETSDLEENEEVKDAPVQRPVHTHYLAKTLEPSVPSFMNTTIPIALGTPTVKRSSVDENKREWMEDATGYSTSAWKPTTPRRLSLAPQLRLNPLAVLAQPTELGFSSLKDLRVYISSRRFTTGWGSLPC